MYATGFRTLTKNRLKPEKIIHEVNLNRYLTFLSKRLKTRTRKINFQKTLIETGFDGEFEGFVQLHIGHIYSIRAVVIFQPLELQLKSQS